MFRITRRFGQSLLLAIGPAAATIDIGAQQAARIIEGRIVDVREQPVPLASITVVGGPSVVSDDSGRFRLAVAHKDRIAFDVKRIGYMPSRIALVDGGDTTLSVLLLPATQELPGVEVRDAAGRPPGLAGFEQRMKERQRGAGTGHFLTAKDIEAMQPLRVTQVVENVPSMAVRRVGGDRFAIYGRLSSGGECAATVYLDGVRIAGVGDVLTGKDRRGRPVVMRGDDGGGISIDQFVTPTELAGVEVYARGMLAPVRLQPNDPNAMKCAIVAFWTKHAT